MHREGSEFDPQCDYHKFAFCPWPATDHGIRDCFCESGGEVADWSSPQPGFLRESALSAALVELVNVPRNLSLSRIIIEKLTV